MVVTDQRNWVSPLVCLLQVLFQVCFNYCVVSVHKNWMMVFFYHFDFSCFALHMVSLDYNLWVCPQSRSVNDVRTTASSISQKPISFNAQPVAKDLLSYHSTRSESSPNYSRQLTEYRPFFSCFLILPIRFLQNIRGHHIMSHIR